MSALATAILLLQLHTPQGSASSGSRKWIQYSRCCRPSLPAFSAQHVCNSRMRFALPKFSSSLLERSSREPAGIIHQAVQFSIALHGLFYQRCTLLFLPHVSRAEEGFAALFANDSGRLLAALLLNIPENDGGAFCGKEAGASESDALCRSCDNDNFLL